MLEMEYFNREFTIVQFYRQDMPFVIYEQIRYFYVNIADEDWVVRVAANGN